VRFFLLLILAARVHACSCNGNWSSVKQAWAEAPFVFLGTVELADPDRPASETIFQEQSVRIRVDEAFKGVTVGQMIELHQGGSDCDAKFRTGQRAVFYLQGEPGSWYLPWCTYSLGDAAPGGDDLLFLHGLPKSAIGTRLSGEVLYEDSAKEAFKRVGGLANVRVKISGPSGSSFEAKTNPDGAYEVYNLRPGKYTVSIDVPNGLRSFDPTTVELEKDGGVRVGFVLKADTRLSGHLFDTNGSPKQGVCIDLEPLEGRGEDGARFLDCSEEDGGFQMEMMPPGKYWLVVHDEIKGDQSKSTSTLYYPGVRDRDNAKIISVEAGKYLENIGIKLPADEKRYQITGRMLFQDGAPVSGAVTFTSSQHGYTETTSTAADGSFSLLIVAGMEGQLEGAMSVLAIPSVLESCPEFKAGQIRGMSRSLDTNSISISNDSDQKDLKLVLPSPSCKAWPPAGNRQN
jgi:hypothetical protein